MALPSELSVSMETEVCTTEDTQQVETMQPGGNGKQWRIWVVAGENFFSSFLSEMRGHGGGREKGKRR